MKAKYRPPYRVYVDSSWDQFSLVKVCESLDEVTKYGNGLYDVREGWYVEDANGQKVKSEDIPQKYGYYEVTIEQDGTIEDIFSGWHAGTKRMPTKRKIMYIDCTGPSMGKFINKKRDRLRVGYGKTMEAAIRHAGK